jgi:ferredoxin
MEAEQRNPQPNRVEDIEIIGADLAEVKIPDFKLPQVAPGNFGLDPMPWHQQILQPFFKSAYTVRPRVIWDRCIACGSCIEGCPMGAVSLVNEKAYIDDDKCIRCYCCHELCPEEAVGLHRSWLYQLLKPVN